MDSAITGIKKVAMVHGNNKPKSKATQGSELNNSTGIP